MSDIVLIAPRPLRVASLSASQRPSFSPGVRMMSPPMDALARVKLADGDQSSEDDASPSSGRNSASPRLNLPSDALEEFLSILRPSLFTPNSPTFRALRHESGSALMVPIERPQAFRPHDGPHNESPSISSVAAEDGNFMNAAGSASPVVEGRQCGNSDQRSGSLWRVPGILESPVSRTHTRNPFQRHPSYEMALSSVLTNHLSPSLLPLPPSPSPAPLSLSPPAVVRPADSEETDT